MLKGHKSKIDSETQPGCTFWKVKETPEHFLLNCVEFEKEGAKLEKVVKELCNNKKTGKSYIDLDGLSAEKFLLSTQKEI